MGIVPSKRRWERKMRARDRSVKFQGHATNNVDKVNNVRLKIEIFQISFNSIRLKKVEKKNSKNI